MRVSGLDSSGNRICALGFRCLGFGIRLWQSPRITCERVYWVIFGSMFSFFARQTSKACEASFLVVHYPNNEGAVENKRQRCRDADVLS